MRGQHLGRRVVSQEQPLRYLMLSVPHLSSLGRDTLCLRLLAKALLCLAGAVQWRNKERMEVNT